MPMLGDRLDSQGIPSMVATSSPWVRLACALAALTGLACANPARSHVPGFVAPWLRADPRRCLLVRDLSASMEVMAQRCAEQFVRENGYTDVPATDDSTRWVLEVEEGGAWTRVLATRNGTLDRQAATSQCSMRQCMVLFRVVRPVPRCTYRAVTMSQVFTRLRLEPGDINDLRCGERRA